jgi:hypothetical protein
MKLSTIRSFQDDSSAAFLYDSLDGYVGNVVAEVLRAKNIKPLGRVDLNP